MKKEFTYLFELDDTRVIVHALNEAFARRKLNQYLRDIEMSDVVTADDFVAQEVEEVL